MNCTKNLFIIPFCLVFFFSSQLSAENSASSNSGFRVVFLSGDVKCQTGAGVISLKTGSSLAVDDIIITGLKGKAKLFNNDRKIMITVLKNTKVRFIKDDAVVIEGDDTSLFRKDLTFLRPDPELDELSQQIGGTYVMRFIREDDSFSPVELFLKFGADFILQMVDIVIKQKSNLNKTFIRDTRPTFRWTYVGQDKYLLELFKVGADGTKSKLWQRQILQDSLAFPEDEPDLEQGKIHYWELQKTAPVFDVQAENGIFYVLSPDEIASFNRGMTELDRLMEEDREDQVTFNITKIALLSKYHLIDELKPFIVDFLKNYSENEE